MNLLQPLTKNEMSSVKAVHSQPQPHSPSLLQGLQAVGWSRETKDRGCGYWSHMGTGLALQVTGYRTTGQSANLFVPLLLDSKTGIIFTTKHCSVLFPVTVVKLSPLLWPWKPSRNISKSKAMKTRFSFLP